MSKNVKNLVDVSDIFYFFLLGEGEGRVRGAGRGGRLIFIENPRRGVLQRGGAEAPGGCLRRIGEFGGGGLNIFFRGRNVHQEKFQKLFSQEVSEYGFVYASERRKSHFSVDSKLRTQLTKQPPQSSSKGNFFVRVWFGGVPSTVEEVVRVRFCCLLS